MVRLRVAKLVRKAWNGLRGHFGTPEADESPGYEYLTVAGRSESARSSFSDETHDGRRARSRRHGSGAALFIETRAPDGKFKGATRIKNAIEFTPDGVFLQQAAVDNAFVIEFGIWAKTHGESDLFSC